MSHRILVLPGDGIGPEVTVQAVLVLERVGQLFSQRFEFSEQLMGGCSIDAHGTALTDAVLEEAKRSDAVLLGAVGGPK
ncbi:MAG: isocitrate/isopropylmalate family dehydrogenase, partial [Candidatus Binatia bacterium]